MLFGYILRTKSSFQIYHYELFILNQVKLNRLVLAYEIPCTSHGNHIRF